MARKLQNESPVALTAVVALHVVAVGGLLHYQPHFSAASAQVMQVSLVTLPAQAPAEKPPEPPKPKPKVRKTITPPPPLEIPSQTAISVPAPPPEPEVVAVADPEPPAPPAPVVPPRFDADYLQNPPPAYPAQSRRAGEQGRVLLRVVVRADGTAQSVELRQSSGSQRLDEAALEAVRRWRFVPARQGSVPISAAVLVPIVFSLES